MAMVPGALWLKAHGGGANVVMRANSIVAALNAAIFGMGIAAVPCWIGDQEKTLRRASAKTIGARDVFLVVHPDLAKIARVRAVIDFIVAAFKRDRAAWTGEAVSAAEAEAAR
jgi:DNA-binding transcriptional LysR family regulator